MMPAKVDDLDYINFLVAAQRTFTCTEASKSQPSSSSSSSSPSTYGEYTAASVMVVLVLGTTTVWNLSVVVPSLCQWLNDSAP